MSSDNPTGRVDSFNPDSRLKQMKSISGESTCTRVDSDEACASGDARLVPQTNELERSRVDISDDLRAALLNQINRNSDFPQIAPSVYMSWAKFHYEQIALGSERIPSYRQYLRAFRFLEQQLKFTRRHRA